ncbi:helix-turn-helix domain-containing protein [Pseudogracilibacillus auburnensis]|uniref:helix-turn-helix domain-containing protein n=1 Tax=Pseudogracilibacillus auburnensis TaxID=1494959 RepID=UPI001A95F9B1|nr:helix-turn-helix transcriptional regulator [Pseudogracilibacillus auburnensis]MBO1005765.1 helix-turn-helix transcriptional regulator [Pseudogracilibacillus auburnensis]
MGFSYDPLWKLLIDKKMTKEDLRIEIKTSPATIAKMGKGENVSMDVLNRICNLFDCDLSDIVRHIKD